MEAVLKEVVVVDAVRTAFGLTTMCVGRGQGYSILWENLMQ